MPGLRSGSRSSTPTSGRNSPRSTSSARSNPSTPTTTPKKSIPKKYITKRDCHVVVEKLSDEEISKAVECVFVRDGEHDIKDFGSLSKGRKSKGEDLCDEDAEALSMLGKYGNATKLLTLRNGDDFLRDKLQNLGGSAFGFRTPRKKNMLEHTMNALSTPQSGKKGSTSLVNSGNVTPTARRAIMNSAVARSNGNTPRRKLAGTFSADTTPKSSKDETPIKKMRLKVTDNDAPTPRATRSRVSKSIAKIQEDSSSEEDDEDEEETDEEDDKKVVERNTRSATKVAKNFNFKSESSKTASTPSRRQRLSVKENTDRYFEAHGSSKIHTSDSTIDKAKFTSNLSPDQLQKILDKLKPQYGREIEDLINEHKHQFKSWLSWLEEGFSLLCYGLGSKKNLLEDFQRYVEMEDSASNFVVVNGFFPSLTLKQILNSITIDFVKRGEEELKFSSLHDQADAICRHFKDLKDEKLYLMVNNIDGLALRGEKGQQILSQLANGRNIHLVASLDHINAPLLWGVNEISKFNFVWFDATTFMPYQEETLNENSLLLRQGGKGGSALALNSLARVFESLTPNAKGVYIMIAKFQLNAVQQLQEESEKDKMKSISYQGISFKDLYHKCRKAFLVNSDLTLRAQLTEFRDHKLIKERKGADDGIDYLLIPLNNGILSEFVEQYESSN